MLVRRTPLEIELPPWRLNWPKLTASSLDELTLWVKALANVHRILNQCSTISRGEQGGHESLHMDKYHQTSGPKHKEPIPAGQLVTGHL